jgi:hypothetical protein
LAHVKKSVTRFHPTALVVEGTGTCAQEVGLAIAALHTDTAVLRADIVPRDVRGRLGRDTFLHLPSGSCPLHSSSLASPPISPPLLPRSHLHSHIRSHLRFYLALTSTLISSASPLLLPRSSSALSPLFRRFTSTLTFPLTSTLTSTFISSVSTVWCDALLNSDATCCSILMRRAAQFRCNGLPDTTHCLMRCAAQL